MRTFQENVPQKNLDVVILCSLLEMCQGIHSQNTVIEVLWGSGDGERFGNISHYPSTVNQLSETVVFF